MSNTAVYRLRTLPKDLGVALVVLVALGVGWLLMAQAEGRTRAYAEPDGGIQISYPAGWIGVDSLLDLLLKVEDPEAASAFKTTLSVERRLLDMADPPTLQTLLDRRVEERGQLSGYHLLADGEATVAGQRAIELEYAYVIQPIDTPRRASLPVVVQARDYIVIAGDSAYYISLAAAAESYAQAEATFERIVRSIELP